MIDLQLSDKIKVLSFLSILSVLYIHSGFHNYSHEILGMRYNYLLQEIVSGKIGRCAVPLFYMISGYLFFLNSEKGLIVIWNKIKKRVYTLGVPFIIACLFFPSCYLLLEMIPETSKFVNGASFSKNFELPMREVLLSLFYKVPQGASPWAFHLWFLRDLIILVGLSPMLFLIRKYVRKELFIFILYGMTLIEIPFFPTAACFWFMLGDAFLPRLNRLPLKYTLGSYVIICIIELCYENFFPSWASIPIILLGVSSIWNLYDKLTHNHFQLSCYPFFAQVCSFTFFIYLYHEPVLNVVRKLLVVIFGQTPWGFAGSYLLSPWLFSALAIGVAWSLKKIFPKFYSILVGGR